MARKLNMSVEHMKELDRLLANDHNGVIASFGQACYDLGYRETLKGCIAGMAIGTVICLTNAAIKGVRMRHKREREMLEQNTTEVQNKNT